jgi:hypothetical protein
LHACTLAGFIPTVALATDDYQHAVPRLVAAGLGVSLTTACVSREVHRPDVALVPVAGIAPRRIIAVLPANPRPTAAVSALLDALLDASMIDELAAADYGSDVEKHRRGIRSLLTVDRLPERLAWHPAEVLELMRWSMPDDPTWKPGSTGRRGHLLRLFSCLVLVRVQTGQDPTDSLAPLVDSALALDPATAQATLRFLAWCRLHEPGDWRSDPTAPPFLTFALLLLHAASPSPDRDAALSGLARALIDELDAIHANPNLVRMVQPEPLLLGLRTHNQHHQMWRALTSRCLVDAPTAGTDPGSRLALLGQAVRGDITASVTDLRALFAPDPPH